MSDIVLATLNAKYAHASFGLRYLLANLAELRPRAELLEFDISQRTVDLLEALLARQPRILGLGVYIWNVEPLTRLVADLKRLAPEICV
ncbi:MAG: B12-binding domain-containing radical SAM protein, partial [Planctomycetaceae bacterium]